MSYTYAASARYGAVGSLYRILSAFPIASFSLAVVTDIAYWQTANLLWLHFSEWLLFAGIVFGVTAALVRLLEAFVGRVWLPWSYYLAGLVVLILAALNNFIHTADGITAVLPYGLALSVLTVLAMVATGLFGRIGVRHV